MRKKYEVNILYDADSRKCKVVAPKFNEYHEDDELASVSVAVCRKIKEEKQPQEKGYAQRLTSSSGSAFLTRRIISDDLYFRATGLVEVAKPDYNDEPWYKNIAEAVNIGHNTAVPDYRLALQWGLVQDTLVSMRQEGINPTVRKVGELIEFKPEHFANDPGSFYLPEELVPSKALIESAMKCELEMENGQWVRYATTTVFDLLNIPKIDIMQVVESIPWEKSTGGASSSISPIARVAQTFSGLGFEEDDLRK